MNEVAARIEYIDESIARTGHVIMLLFALECVGDIDLAVQILDTERSKARR